jgi:hypothetical protein
MTLTVFPTVCRCAFRVCRVANPLEHDDDANTREEKFETTPRGGVEVRDLTKKHWLTEASKRE